MHRVRGLAARRTHQKSPRFLDLLFQIIPQPLDGGHPLLGLDHVLVCFFLLLVQLPVLALANGFVQLVRHMVVVGMGLLVGLAGLSQDREKTIPFVATGEAGVW